MYFYLFIIQVVHIKLGEAYANLKLRLIIREDERSESNLVMIAQNMKIINSLKKNKLFVREYAYLDIYREITWSK